MLHARLTSKKGQAALEVAIFGGIFLFVLGVLVKYGLSMSYQEQMKMYAFRKAQIAALGSWDEFANANVPYTVVTDRRVPDPKDPMGTGERLSLSDTSSAQWTNRQGWPVDLPPSRALIEIIDANDSYQDGKLVRNTTGYVYGTPAGGDLFGHYGDPRTTTSAHRVVCWNCDGIWHKKNNEERDHTKRHEWIPVGDGDLDTGDSVSLGNECGEFALNSVECSMLRKAVTILDCTKDEDNDNHCDKDEDFTVVDYTGGEIDQTITDYDVLLSGGTLKRQGLSSATNSTSTSDGSYMTSTDNGEQKGFVIQNNMRDQVDREIITRSGSIPHSSVYERNDQITDADWR